tara:strand:- start:8044 stop:8745 length:702 start_codon:yes stop_codon:yes gene_type:complete
MKNKNMRIKYLKGAKGMMIANSKSVTCEHTRSVLLVEDVIMSSSAFKIALQDLGYLISEHIQANDFNELKLKPNNQHSNKNKIDPPLLCDLLIINTTSPSESLLVILDKIDQIAPLPVILFTKNKTDNVINVSIQAGISAYIVDDLNPTQLSHLMTVAEAQFKQRQSLRSELQKTKTQLANRKIVERAKGYLMQQKSITEQDAFVLLRTMAMNNGQTLATVSQHVTDVYSLGN